MVELSSSLVLGPACVYFHVSLPQAAAFWLLLAECEHSSTVSPGTATPMGSCSSGSDSLGLPDPSHGGTGRAQAQAEEATGA